MSLGSVIFPTFVSSFCGLDIVRFSQKCGLFIVYWGGGLLRLIQIGNKEFILLMRSGAESR